ncbi:transmembrane protein 97 [Arapaima gigas]
MCTRVLELVFFLYFATHIPITLFIDLQALLPGQIFPQPLKDLVQWYTAEAKDHMMADPPVWFKSIIFCEFLLQMPFFPIAAYAFLKGGCRWIRTPAIIYSTHVISVMVPILTYMLFHQFPKGPHPGPQTTNERLIRRTIPALRARRQFRLAKNTDRSPQTETAPNHPEPADPVRIDGQR